MRTLTKMTKAEVISKVGQREYQDACVRARHDADRPDFGRDLGKGEITSDLPHQITDLIWGGDCTWREKIALFFEIYDDMPGYGHLMYVTHHYRDFSMTDRQAWWALVRERLASGDLALDQPLAYSLWCDFFEDAGTVAEAWAEVASEAAPERVLRAALRASGPVPYPLKRRVYDRLLPDPAWHGAIFESLLYSAFDYFGQIEPADACVLLTSLQLAADTEHLSMLREKIGCATLDTA
jgi:hypothetical protein